jgi:AcrR family transcriptional regulator
MSQRREALLDLAEELLERDGLEAFGIGTFARAAGVQPPSLYKHFSGLPDIENALISRGFIQFATAMADAAATAPANDRRAQLAAFARTYREAALARPQHYRMMTARALDRDALEPGAETAAMLTLIGLFGETLERYDTARAAWAWAHGLTILEIANRFPPDADVGAAWGVLLETLAMRLPAN